MSQSSAGGGIKRYLPYIIGAVALGWVLHKTDRHQLLAALEHTPLGTFVVVSTLMLFINLMADTFAMTSVFGWFGIKVAYRDLFFVRAATYLLSVINYHVGQAAIVGYLYRTHRVPFLRATGCILFIIGINVGTLFLLASTGASRATGEMQFLRVVPYVCVVGVAVYALLLKVQPAILAKMTLFQPLFEMGIWGHVKGVAVRLPHVFTLLVWHYLALNMFGAKIGPLDALIYLPAYFAASSLPIGVNGLGGAQLVALALFRPLVPAGAGDPNAIITAYSICTAGISLIFQVAIGIICLGKAVSLGLKESA